MSINTLGTLFHDRPQLCASCRPLSANVWKDPCHQMSTLAYINQTCPKQSQKSPKAQNNNCRSAKGRGRESWQIKFLFSAMHNYFFLTWKHNILVYTCQILIQLFKRHWLRYFSGFLDEISCLAKFFISTAMKNWLMQFNLIDLTCELVSIIGLNFLSCLFVHDCSSIVP